MTNDDNNDATCEMMEMTKEDELEELIITPRQPSSSKSIPTTYTKFTPYYKILILLMVVSATFYLLNERSNNNNNDDQSSLVRITNKHPGCFSATFFSKEGNTKKLNYAQLMKYSLLGKNVTKSVRYNHLCPWMKIRYNCAKNKTLQYGKSAYDWKLILEQGTNKCYIWGLIHDLGGPVGVAKSILKDVAIGKKEKYIVALFGNSYLRQMLQAFMCGWSNDISYTLMQKNSNYSISIDGLAKRHGAPIRIDEVGNMVRMPMVWEGDVDSCGEILEQNASFYNPGVALPRRCANFDDNIAVVEFGGKIRFYYIFRPQVYEDLSTLMREKLQLEPKDIDSLVFNDGQEKTIIKDTEMLKVFKSTGVWQQRIIWQYQQFRDVQIRDINRWFGADNPWITHPPDGHACMPGPPDDEANLLLYLLYSKSIIRSNK